MNDILKEMKNICNVFVKMSGNVKGYSQDEIHLIYNYITNLQKENQELKKQLQIKHDGFMTSTEDLCEYATEYDKLLIHQTEYIKFLNNMIVGFEKKIAYKKHHKEDYSKDVIQLVVYKKCFNQIKEIFEEEV